MISDNARCNNAASTPTRLEVFAAYEQHMSERDALIADRIGCSPAYWRTVREHNPAFWEQMERKAMMTPPRIRAVQLWRQKQERFLPGEYVRWSEILESDHLEPDERSGADRSGAGRLASDILVYAALLLGGIAFIGERIPGIHEFFVSLLH